MASVDVVQVPEGSLVVLRNVVLPAHPRDREDMVANLRKALGHDKFALLSVSDRLSKVEVISDPADFPEWLAEAIVRQEREFEERRSSTTEAPSKRPPLRLPPGSTIRRMTPGEQAQDSSV